MTAYRNLFNRFHKIIFFWLRVIIVSKMLLHDSNNFPQPFSSSNYGRNIIIASLFNIYKKVQKHV